MSQSDFIANDDGNATWLSRHFAAWVNLKIFEVNPCERRSVWHESLCTFAQVVLTCPLGGNSDSWASRIRSLLAVQNGWSYTLDHCNSHRSSNRPGMSTHDGIEVAAWQALNLSNSISPPSQNLQFPIEPLYTCCTSEACCGHDRQLAPVHSISLSLIRHTHTNLRAHRIWLVTGHTDRKDCEFVDWEDVRQTTVIS